MGRDDYRNGKLSIKNIIDETLEESTGDMIAALNKLALLKHEYRDNPIASQMVADAEIETRLAMQSVKKEFKEIKNKK